MQVGIDSPVFGRKRVLDFQHVYGTGLLEPHVVAPQAIGDKSHHTLLLSIFHHRLVFPWRHVKMRQRLLPKGRANQ